MLVLGYNGDASVTNDDSDVKRRIGYKWAEMSDGNCLFLMAVEQDIKGLDVRQQILQAIV